MQLFILTHSSSEQNYRPKVFKTLYEAQEALKEAYDRCLCEEDDIDRDELYEYSAEVVYIDNTYNTFDIFGVEVE